MSPHLISACESGIYGITITEDPLQLTITDLAHGSYFGIVNSKNKIYSSYFFHLNCPLQHSQSASYSARLKSMIILDKNTPDFDIDILIDDKVSESTHYLCIGTVSGKRQLIAQETYSQTIRSFDLDENDEIIENSEQTRVLFAPALNHHFINAEEFKQNSHSHPLTTDGYRHMNAIQIMPDGNILVCCSYLGKDSFGKVINNKPRSTYELFDNSWNHIKSIQLPDNVAHDIILDYSLSFSAPSHSATTFWYAGDQTIVHMSYPDFKELERISIPITPGRFIRGIGKYKHYILVFDETIISIINTDNKSIQSVENTYKLKPRRTISYYEASNDLKHNME